jgi:hypothetical protein
MPNGRPCRPGTIAATVAPGAEAFVIAAFSLAGRRTATFSPANLIDTLHVVQVPILLGRRVRLWDVVDGVEERYDVEAVSSPSGVTHLTFTRR